MNVGRVLMVAGVVLFVVGLLYTTKIPYKPGQLPGDVVIRGKNSVFYFPIVSSILLSIVLTLILWLFNRR
jgi:hypothetical protein